MNFEKIGPYRVSRVLGQGGMGVVLDALHEQIGRRAAIKVLHAPLARDAALVRRFLNEARSVNLVRHLGLVEIADTPEAFEDAVVRCLGASGNDRLHGEDGVRRGAPADDRVVAAAGAMAVLIYVMLNLNIVLIMICGGLLYLAFIWFSGVFTPEERSRLLGFIQRRLPMRKQAVT